ncbi:MAG: hypothetical protein ACM3H8_00105 [Sphingobacteriales bacterium]
MSLFNTGKNKKDKKKGASAAAKASFPAPKGKFNTKGAAKNTRLTGGTQRGS